MYECTHMMCVCTLTLNIHVQIYTLALAQIYHQQLKLRFQSREIFCSSFVRFIRFSTRLILPVSFTFSIFQCDGILDLLAFLAFGLASGPRTTYY